MREATLGLFYFVKYLELIFLVIWSSLLISSGVYFVDKVSEEKVGDSDTMIYVMTAVTCVLVLFNLLYNNLLINIRFFAKMRCVTFGLCCFDAVNFCLCYCFLVKPCRDKCFSPWTVCKWLIKGAVIGYTIYLVQQKKDDWEDAWDAGQYDRDPTNSRFDMYLIVYLLQHPIFILSRIPIFLLYSIVTCCCDKGIDHPEDSKFESALISFDFVEYELGRLNNFENHPVGRNEYEYNRRLSFVRA